MDAPSNPNPLAPNGPNDPLIVDDEPLPKKSRVNENQSTKEPSDIWEHSVRLQNREKSECKYCRRKCTFSLYILIFFHFSPYILFLPLLVPKPINAGHLSP